MKAVRLMDIEKYVLQKGSVTMDELCEHFGVSMNTVRRDVAELLKRGTIEKVYGGVCAKKSDQVLTPYELRLTDHEPVKIAIGRCAANLVTDGDVIFIDSGTTTLQMIDFLATKKDLTIITHNLEVIVQALPYEQMNVIVLPGQLRRKTNSVTGSDASAFLNRYNVRLAFMAATGVSQHGVTNSSPLEYDIKKTAIKNCEKAVLLLGATKFGVSGLMTYADLEDFDMLVTDKEPPSKFLMAIRQANTELVLCEKPSAE